MLRQLNAAFASSPNHQLSKPRDALDVRRGSRALLEYIFASF